MECLHGSTPEDDSRELPTEAGDRSEYDRSGKLILTASDDGEVRVWNEASDRPVAVLRPEKESRLAHALQKEQGTPREAPRAFFNPDGRYLMTVGPGVVEAMAWTVGSWSVHRAFPKTTSDSESAVAPTGRFVFLTTFDRGLLWDTANDRVLELPADVISLRHPHFSPDGRLIALDGAKGIHVWSVAARVEVARFEGETSVFGPGGRSLATGDVDGTVRIYRCDLCAPLRDLKKLARWRVGRTLTPDERSRYLHGP